MTLSTFNITLVCGFLLLLPIRINAQINYSAPGMIQWDKTYSGSASDALNSILALPDGGYLLGGNSQSNPAFEKSDSSRGRSDYWLIRVDDEGNKIWDKTYGGSGSDALHSLALLPDGHILLVGQSDSPISFEKTDSSRGFNDIWIIKIDTLGNILWDKTYGGNEWDSFASLIQLEDGSVIIACSTQSEASGEKSDPPIDGIDYWLLRINPEGEILWDKTIGNDGHDFASDLLLLPDGQFMLGGNSQNDFHVLRMDTLGNIIWEKYYGLANYDGMNAMALLKSGNIILGGGSAGNNPFDANPIEAFSVTIDLEGNLIRQGYTNPSNDYYFFGIIEDISPLPDGGALMIYSKYDFDIYVSKTFSGGGNSWEEKLDVPQGASHGDIISTDDGYLLALSSSSIAGGDKTAPNKVFSDYWLVKYQFEGINPDLEAYIYDAVEDQSKQEILDNVVIDLGTIGTDFLNIVIEDQEENYESVYFRLFGPILHEQFERTAPYALFGDNGKGDFLGRNFPPGDYRLRVTPYLGNDQDTEAGPSLEYSFSMTDGPLTQLDKFVLINAKSDQEVKSIQEGDVFDLNQIGSNFLNFRVDTLAHTFQTESIGFELKKEGEIIHRSTENVIPYALFGDLGESDYRGQFLGPGNYTLKAIPYTDNNQGGAEGIALEVNFQLQGALPEIASFTLINAENNQDLQILHSGDTLDLDALGTNLLSIRVDNPNQDLASVALQFNGPQLEENRVENVEPFTLFGDTLQGQAFGRALGPGHYRLEAMPYSEKKETGLKGLSKSIDFYIKGTSSSLRVSIFPNPVGENQLELKMDEVFLESPSEITIRDQQGNIKLIKSVHSDEVRLDISSLRPGIYHLEVQNAKGAEQKSFLKY